MANLLNRPLDYPFTVPITVLTNLILDVPLDALKSFSILYLGTKLSPPPHTQCKVSNQ